MARRGAAVVGAIILGSILASGAAGAAPLAEPVALSAANNFVTQEIVIQQGESLSFTNLDLGIHSLTAKAVNAATGQPLFDSGLVATRGTSRVVGVEDLGPNLDGYKFVCIWHGAMTGTIRVLPGSVQ